MDSGATEPSWIPNLSTLTVIQHEIALQNRRDRNPVLSICQMKVDPSMKGAIQNIGLDPFLFIFRQIANYMYIAIIVKEDTPEYVLTQWEVLSAKLKK